MGALIWCIFIQEFNVNGNVADHQGRGKAHSGESFTDI